MRSAWGVVPPVPVVDGAMHNQNNTPSWYHELVSAWLSGLEVVVVDDPMQNLAVRRPAHRTTCVHYMIPLSMITTMDSVCGGVPRQPLDRRSGPDLLRRAWVHGFRTCSSAPRRPPVCQVQV